MQLIVENRYGVDNEVWELYFVCEDERRYIITTQILGQFSLSGELMFPSTLSNILLNAFPQMASRLIAPTQ